MGTEVKRKVEYVSYLKKESIHKFKKKKNFSKYKPKRKQKNIKGGSIIYQNGDIIETNETFNGKPFFRKVFYQDNDKSSEKYIRLRKAANAEIQISLILQKNPFPNIVTFYEINNNYIEMEELNMESKKNLEKVKETMEKVKGFLQSIGIMYIDWKIDNIGISKDGVYKLFDFDASGIIDLKTNNWIIKPLEDYWSFKKAIENGYSIPQEMDDFSFNYNIMKLETKIPKKNNWFW